jgi:hypothetical protein
VFRRRNSSLVNVGRLAPRVGKAPFPRRGRCRGGAHASLGLGGIAAPSRLIFGQGAATSGVAAHRATERARFAAVASCAERIVHADRVCVAAVRVRVVRLARAVGRDAHRAGRSGWLGRRRATGESEQGEGEKSGHDQVVRSYLLRDSNARAIEWGKTAHPLVEIGQRCPLGWTIARVFDVGRPGTGRA